MPQYRHTNGDVVTVSEALVGYMDTQPGFQRELTEVEVVELDEEIHELKGAQLDAALEEAGLSKTGTADEKRDRLADHNLNKES